MFDHTSTSRRRLLQAAGATAALTTVAGCIGGSDDDSITYISRGGSTQDAERELFEQWSEESGVSVEHQEVADDTEMMNMIAENPGDIDFTNPASWGFTVDQFEHDGELLADLDYGEVPNYTDLIDDPWHDAPFLEGHDKGMFYYISTQGLAYNTERADDVTSWHDVKDGAYEDEVAMFDSGPARFGNCAATLGYDPAEAASDEEMFGDVLEEMAEQDVNVFTYWSTGDEMMRLLREEAATLASAWGGRVQVLQDDGYPVEYIIPDEGCVTWSTGFAIAEESENKDLVYDLLDWVYQEENLVELNTSTKYPTPIEDPPEEIRSLGDYTEHPDDLAWIDFTELLPRFEELEQELAEIQTS